MEEKDLLFLFAYHVSLHFNGCLYMQAAHYFSACLALKTGVAFTNSNSNKKVGKKD